MAIFTFKNHIMNRFLKYFIPITIILLGCNKPKKAIKVLPKPANDTISINGNFKTPGVRREIYLGNEDEFQNHNEYSTDLKVNELFSYKLISKSSIIIRDDDALGQVNYLLMGRDNVYINEDDSTHLLIFKTTNNTIRNNELYFFCAFKNHRSEMPYYKAIEHITYQGPPDQDYKEYYIPFRSNDLSFVENYAKTKFNNESAFLNNYAQSRKISSKFRTCVEDIFYFEYMRTKIRIALASLQSGKKVASDFDNEITTFKSKTQLANYLYIPDYKRSLDLLAEYYWLKNDHKGSLYESIKQNFSGVNKNYLLFAQVKKSLSVQPIDRTLLNAFYKDCNSVDFKNEIIRNVKLMTIGKNTMLIGDSGLKYSFDELKARYTGQVLYIDFWASWCVPCLRQMAHSKKLHDDLKTLPIRFIYCSMDNSMSAWETKALQLNLDKNNSFIVTNGFKSDLSKSFNIRTIPRYIIIGKDGKVFSTEGYLPDDEATKAYLIRLCSN